ncbi:DUF1796 family putative cysteine peptidase [Bacillus sp. DJP31]|uniref:DUF1796 family putative cysteine peptidase n=1 Tax=Bacillus sp. DJP31 TaxID=3409789 RepID=UPI003BB4B1F8
MRIQDLKGEYSAIFSLGDLCLAALQLRKSNLRPFAGPLDWMSSPSLSDVSRLLNNKFIGFMDLENLTPIGYSTGVDSAEPYIAVTDNAYHIVSSHDFKASRNTLSQLATYPDVRVKLDRRTERFLYMLKKCKRILLIRTEGTFEEVLELEAALSKIGSNNFHILVVNHTNVSGITEKEWPVKRVCSIELPDVEKWSGNDHLWRSIFEGITIKA